MTTTDDRIAPPATINDHNWRDFAACRNTEPDAWFPVGTSTSTKNHISFLKTFCVERCPAIDFCLRWAIETGQEAGVWGGMSEDERRSMKRKALRQRARSGGES